mgnify:FL=1
MEFDLFAGVLAAVLIGNGLSVACFYAIFWADAQIRRGKNETELPAWVYIAGTVPPLIASAAAYAAFY